MGRTDGGRMAMAAYGRRSLSVTSILSYLGLAIGILGGDLALNWGLYVLIVQRDPETAPLDDITAVDEKRTALAGALVVRARRGWPRGLFALRACVQDPLWLCTAGVRCVAGLSPGTTDEKQAGEFVFAFFLAQAVSLAVLLPLGSSF